jgi:hypothetical protein
MSLEVVESPHAGAAGLADAILGTDTAATEIINPDGDFLSRFSAVPEIKEDAEPEVKPEDAPEPEVKDAPAPDPEKKEGEEEEDPYGEQAPDPKDANANKKWVELKGDIKKTKAELRAERDSVAGKLSEKDKAIEERDRQIEELRSKATDYESKVPEIEELRQKAARVDEVEKELSIHRVESSQEYKRTITEPLNAISSRLETIAKENDVDVNALFDAVAETDPAKQRALLKEILPTLDEVDKPMVVRAAEDTRGILSKSAQMREDAANARKELEERQTAESTKAKEAGRKEFKSAVEKTMEGIKARIPHVELVKGETPEGVFAAMTKEAAEIDFDSMTTEGKALAAGSGLALVRALKVIGHLQTENKTLRARTASDKETNPAIKETPTKAPEKQATFRPVPASVSFLDNIP